MLTIISNSYNRLYFVIIFINSYFFHNQNNFPQTHKYSINTTLPMDKLKETIIKFQKDRNWKQFHTPENLAKSISIEAGELLEHFQWDDNYDLEEVADELADVFNYCILMADSLNLDIKEITLNKIRKNELKYPISKSKNNSTKYTKL